MRVIEPEDVEMWSLWERISVPRLVIRGESSDLLLPDTLDRMRASGAKTFVVPRTGHAPALMDPAQIAAIRNFLEAE
jgi:pimeloyl-ACP methyl ester carboxylesterase